MELKFFAFIKKKKHPIYVQEIHSVEEIYIKLPATNIYEVELIGLANDTINYY